MSEQTIPGKSGRPSKDTPEVRQLILEGLADGIPLTVILEPEHMPGVTTVWDWEKKDPAFSESIVRAREAGEYKLAWQCKNISDTPLEAVTEKWERMQVGKTDDGTPVFDLVMTERKVDDALGHRKLQVDTRLKLLAKFNPRKWGERQQLEHTGTLTLEQLVAGDQSK